MSQAFPLSFYRPSHVFSLNNSFYFDTSQKQEFSSRRSISCSTSRSDHLLMHLLAFFDFLAKRLMFPQIIRSTQLDTPCLQQSRKTKTCNNYLFLKKVLQGACADVFTRPTLLWFNANGRSIVALCFAGHRTIEMLGPVGPKVWPVSNCTQQVPTSANIVLVPCKRTQQVITLLGPTVLGVVGQQCCVRLHEPLKTHSIC